MRKVEKIEKQRAESMAHGAERYEFGSGNYLNVEVGMRNAEKKKSKGQRAWRIGQSVMNSEVGII